MITIYVDGRPLYNPVRASDGYAITAGTTETELGYAGSASLTVPPVNIEYSSLRKMKSIIQIFQDEEEIFFGRILHDEKDFFRNNTLYLEGALSFFSDYIMPPHSMQTTFHGYISQVLGVYNSQAETTKQIQAGMVTVPDAETVRDFANIEFTTIQDALYKPLIETYGGYFRVRYNPINQTHYLDYMALGSETSLQTIEFGENLTDLSNYTSAEDTITTVIPLGAMQYDADNQPIGRVNITSVTEGGVEYVTDLQAAYLFGNIWKAVVWEDVTDPAALKTLGEKYLEDHKAETITITIGAVDLHLINPEIDSIRLGDLVRVVSTPHGIDSVYQCAKVHYDLLNPANTSYTLGVPLKMISAMQADISDAVQTMEEGDAESTLQFLALTARIAALEAENARPDIRSTDLTTIAAIYAAVPDMGAAYYYLGANVTDRPVNVGGTLAIYRLTDQYGALVYYANNAETYRGSVEAGTLQAWKKVTVS